MAPPAISVLLIGFFSFEWDTFVESEITREHILELVCVIFTGSVIVFGMILAEMTFNMKTSSLTIDVVQTIKQLLIMLLSCFIFGDKLTGFNVTGMIIVCFGVIHYAMPHDGVGVQKHPAPVTSVGGDRVGDDNYNDEWDADDVVLHGDAEADKGVKSEASVSSVHHRHPHQTRDDGMQETDSLLP